MNKKIIIVLILIIFLYPGCKHKQKELVIAFPSGTYIVDPHLTNWATDINVFDNVFESLVKKSFDFRIEPSLAYRWYNPKPKEWVFDILPGIFFHNNKELTAKDIVKNFKRLKKLSIYSPYIFIVNSIEKVLTEGKYKVKFCLNKRIPDFLIQISDIKIIYFKDSFKINRKLKKKDLIGTGPFKFDKIEKHSILLTRFNRYWGEKGVLEKIKFVFNYKFSEKSLEDNYPDIISNLSVKLNNNLSEYYNIINKPSNFVYFLILNPRVKPLSDIKVRKYISQLINRKKLVNYLNIPEDYISNTFVPPWLKHNYITKKQIADYNISPNQKRKKMIIIYPDSDFINMRIAKYIYNLLKKQGFSNLELKEETNKKWRFTLFDDGIFSITPFRYATDTGGVDDILVRFFHTRTKYHGVLNMFNYSNKNLDKLIDLGLKEIDANLRYDYFVKAHKIAIGEKVFLPLFIKPNIFYIKKSVKIKNFTSIGFLNSIE